MSSSDTHTGGLGQGSPDPRGHGATALLGALRGDSGDDTAALDRLRSRLGADADRESLLDVAYRELDTPIGRLLVAATPRGVVRVAFDRQGFDAVLTDLAARVSPRVLRAPARLDETARQLDAYLSGGRRDFDLPLDRSLSHGFGLLVHRHLSEIDYGATASYGDVARDLGSPRAVRAVGTACARNPLPLLVPCHRVIRSDGSTGDYAGGAETKRTLLALEHAA